jgi:hypothetical protein
MLTEWQGLIAIHQYAGCVIYLALPDLSRLANPAQWATSRVHLCTFRTLGMTFSKEIPLQSKAEALVILKRGQAFSYPHQVPGAKNCYDIHVHFWMTETFVSMTWGIMLHVLLAVPCCHTNKMVAIFLLLVLVDVPCNTVLCSSTAGILHVTTSLPFEQNSRWALPVAEWVFLVHKFVLSVSTQMTDRFLK